MDSQRARVLLVDDNPLVRHLLGARAQQRSDVELETFISADELFARLDQIKEPIDLVVIDGELQSGDLSPETEKIATALVERDLPVLLVLDRVSHATARRGMIRGTRPVSIDEIAMIAHRQRARRSALRLSAVTAADILEEAETGSEND